MALRRKLALGRLAASVRTDAATLSRRIADRQTLDHFVWRFAVALTTVVAVGLHVAIGIYTACFASRTIRIA
jgi:hypothetical protein